MTTPGAGAGSVCEPGLRMAERSESIDLATSAADMGAASASSSPSSGGGGRTPVRDGDGGGEPLPSDPENAIATCRHFSVLLPFGTSSALTPSRFNAAMTSSDSFITLSTAVVKTPSPVESRSSEPPWRRRNALILRRSAHSFSRSVAFVSRLVSVSTAEAVTASSVAGGPALGSARLAASVAFLNDANSSATTLSSGVSSLNLRSILARSVLSCAISARS